ncbi:MAG: glycosyltransferase family 1 protein [Candidatus Schekmanbacteria bacterium]|nr:MAG: glycosyltransferase family 1 protein [Candidatus Schekmanbacteria bacterium]
MEKYNFRKSSLIRVLSRYTSERLKKFASIDDSKIKIIPGGVNEDRFCPVNNKQMLRKKFNLPAESIIFSTLRNMEPRMGLENLIKAIKKIKNHCTSSLFVIGGSGPLKSKLENMAHSEGLSDLIIFAGYIDENNLSDFYRMSDYFLLPTVEQEGFGLVTVEALASGVPVLGTPAGATPEILSKVDKKLIFSSTEVDSLAEGILQWIDIYKNKKEYYDEISKKGRRVVEEHYTWEKSAEKLLTIYKSIL